MLIELVTREAIMLAALVALGAGPASFLNRNLGFTYRLLISPVLGFCVGACVFTTLVWFYPASTTAWTLPVIAAVSTAVAVLRWLRSPGPTLAAPRRPRSGGLMTALQVAVICVAVLGPVNYSLSSHASDGPVVYKTADIDGWVMQTDGMEHLSLSSQVARGTHVEPDLVLEFWNSDANASGWPTEASALEASLNSLLGLGATDTESSFFAVYLLMAALAAFAAVRYAIGKTTWGGALAGSLFGGTLFLQLYFDGAVPVVCGVAVLLGLATVGIEALADSRLANLALVALLLAGTAAALPLYLAPVAFAGAAVLGTRLVRRRGTLDRRTVRDGLVKVAAVVGLPFLFGPVGSYRAVLDLSQMPGLVRGVPKYHLNLLTVPEWVTQTRSLYDLGTGGQPVIEEVLLGVVVPMLFLVALGFFLRSRLLLITLVPLAVASAIIGVSGDVSEGTSGSGCTYCLDRGLDPIAAFVPVGLGIAVALLAASRHRPLRWSAPLLLVAVIPAVGFATHRELHRFDSGSYFLDSSVRSVAGHLRGTGCTVLEGFNEAVPSPPGEQVLVYALADERYPGNVGLLTDFDDNGALKYFHLGAQPKVDGIHFCPDYDYVLTRIASIATNRVTIFRAGNIALERPTGALNVLLDYGVLVLSPDTAASPPTDYVANTVDHSTPEPLQFVVTGNSAGPVHVQVGLQILSAGAPAQFSSPSPMAVRRQGTAISVCVDATGSAPARTAQFNLESPTATAVTSMSAAPGACPPSGTIQP